MPEKCSWFDSSLIPLLLLLWKKDFVEPKGIFVYPCKKAILGSYFKTSRKSEECAKEL